MNQEKYIETGILELYVAGALPEEEMIAVTEKVKTSVELKAEVERIEMAFIAFAGLHAPKIPFSLQAELFAKTSAATGGSVPNTPTASPSQTLCKIGWLLFAISTIFGIWQYQQSSSAANEAANETTRLEQEQQLLEDKLEQTQQIFAAIRNPATESIVLASVGKVPDAEAVVYWNTETTQLFVDASKLPTPPEGKVYQLWWMISLDPLTPFDAGTLDNFTDNDEKVFAAKSAGKAVAFAITLEPAGGSVSPTLEELYVLGKV